MATGWPDVSMHQGLIDWAAVRADLEVSGLPLVAITKATEGWGYVDPQFHRNWAEMKRVGLRRGAYGFARPDLGSRAKDEADWLHSVVRPEGDDFLIDDLEAGGGNLLWWACEYADELNALMRSQQGMYSGWWFMAPQNVYGPEIGRRCWLHLAAYQSAAPAPPPGWDSVAIQQFTSSGRLAGVAGDVDLNRTLNPAALGGQLPAAPPGDNVPMTDAERFDVARCIVRLAYVVCRGQEPESLDVLDAHAKEMASGDMQAVLAGMLDRGEFATELAQRRQLLGDYLVGKLSGAPGPAGPPGPAYDDAKIQQRVAELESIPQRIIAALTPK